MALIALRTRIKAVALAAFGATLLALLFILPGHVSAIALLLAIPLVGLPLAMFRSHRDAVRDELAREAMKRHYAHTHPAR